MSSLTNRDQACTTTLLAAVIVILICCDYFSISNRSGGSATAQELIYPGQAKSERDLPTCEAYEICSVVHKRYWFTNKVERLCRCDGDQKECSSNWSEWTADPYTMSANNRAQLKFCDPVTALPSCLEADRDTSVDTNEAQPRPSSLAQQRFLKVVNETRTETLNNVSAQNYKLTSKAQCYCPPHNTWIAHAFQKNESSSAGAVLSYMWTSYRCSQLPKCKTGDICGFERTDFYSNYYKCSCPRENVCTRPIQPVTLQVNELLYEGPAFVAHCQSQSKNK